MTRVCMVAYTHYRTDARVRREAEALAKRGDSVDVICLGSKPVKSSVMYNGVRLIELITNRYRGANTKTYLASYLSFFIFATFRLSFLFLKERYQIIQVHTMPDFMVFVAIIPKLLGAKVILDVHDLMPELYQSKFHLSSRHLAVRFIIWVERCSIKFADRAIAVHKPHLEALCRHGNLPEKFSVLLNLPDPDVFPAQAIRQMSDNELGFDLIYHGTVSRRHGLEIAIRAVSLLRDRIDGLSLRIIGEGDDISRLNDLVEELCLQSLIQIRKGVFPMEELIPQIQNADLGVVPILLDEFTQYMLPAKLLEYVALGVPVVCTRTETIQTYFDDTMVQFFSSGSVDELAEKILILYQDPDRRKELSREAERFNLQFNWENQKRAYYKVIDDLVGVASSG